MILYLFGAPSPIFELFGLAVLLYIGAAVYFGLKFEAESPDQYVDDNGELE